MAHGETSAERSSWAAEMVAVLGAGRTIGQAVGEHGDEDISATYLISVPEQVA